MRGEIVSNLKDYFKNYIPNLIGANNVLYASVVIPLIKINGEYNIIFEVRSDKLKQQPGEISFPGGKIECGETPQNAAIREFCEELMCSKESIEIISEVDMFFSPTRALIHCFLAEIDESLNLDIKNDEVSEVFCVPLSFFENTKPKEFINVIEVIPDEKFQLEEMMIRKNYNWGSTTYPIYFYKYEDKIIWGITANITRNFVKKLNSML